MNAPSSASPSDASARAVRITRVAQDEWHALEDDLVVGRGYASARHDGRLFVGVDAWREPVFDRLAAALLADLPRPLRAVVDEAEPDSAVGWERAGFAPHRREWHYLVPTDPALTGLRAGTAPAGVAIVPVGEAAEEPLRALDRVIRAEVAAGPGWQTMPAEILARPGHTVVDPAKYAVAARGEEYIGLLRVVSRKQHARIGLLAVRADEQRRGIARALLAEVLGTLHANGCAAASAEVDASNAAAIALFEGLGARRAGSYLEFLRR